MKANDNEGPFYNRPFLQQTIVQLELRLRCAIPSIGMLRILC